MPEATRPGQGLYRSPDAAISILSPLAFAGAVEADLFLCFIRYSNFKIQAQGEIANR